MAGKTAKEKQKEIEEKAKAALAQESPAEPPADGEMQQAITEPPAGGESTQESTQPPAEGETQQATADPPAGDEAQEPAEINEEPLEGKALVVYNGYINIRRAPLMSDDAICGQVRRGQVLNVVATVTMKGVEFFRLAGGEYIKADKKLVEFTEA